jgi:SAM-dependent methyltransferase
MSEYNMNKKRDLYTPKYFKSEAFTTDYETLASVIIELYKPKTVVDFGCGPGHLSREIAKLGVEVTSVDGYSQPNFSGLPVQFHRLDLNDSEAIKALFSGKKFDLAICLEVAEHLKPESSNVLIKYLTQMSPVVVFSAAVPGQGGDGHINERSRTFWHDEFTQNKFVIADRVRSKLRLSSTMANWYRYNVTDYTHIQHPQAPDLSDLIPRLIASESAAAEGFFKEYAMRNYAEDRLKYAPIRLYTPATYLRDFIKNLFNKA